MLNHDAPPESVLSLAVRAVAFADTKNARNGNDIAFSVRAQRSYGAALAQMRAISDNEQELANDRVLAALLLIDCYEVLTSFALGERFC